MNILSFDVGGMHVSAALVSRGRVVSIENSSLPSDASRENLTRLIGQTGQAALLAAGSAISDVSLMAFAFPSPFDYQRGICLMKHKHSSLYEMDLRSSFANYFDLAPDCIVFLNDASAFLLGATTEEMDAGRVFGITLGTGIGAAFPERGMILERDTRVPEAGEIWNLPWRNGQIEDFLGSRAIQERYAEHTGCNKSVAEIARGSAVDPDSSSCFLRFRQNFR
jgi:glucokinase